MPRVTIVVRTRDRAPLLRRALVSISRQTLTDYEVVIVNDGGAEAEVRAVLSEAPPVVVERTRIVTNPVSRGREAALEDGLAVSHSEFFAVHDDDDSWEPAFLERCVAYLDEHPDAGAVATRCDVVHEALQDGLLVETSREVLAADRLTWSLVDTLVVNFVPPISQLIRRSAADEIGHWDPSLLTQADWDFNLRLQSRYPVGFLAEEVLAHWHQRPAQGNSLGNSVTDHAAQHHRDNLEIRDRYVRQAAGESLGAMLVSAEYFQRLEQALGTANEHVLRSLGETHKGLGQVLLLVDAQRQQIEVLEREVARLVANRTMTERMIGVLKEPRRAASIARRLTRRLVRRR